MLLQPTCVPAPVQETETSSSQKHVAKGQGDNRQEGKEEITTMHQENNLKGWSYTATSCLTMKSPALELFKTGLEKALGNLN